METHKYIKHLQSKPIEHKKQIIAVGMIMSSFVVIGAFYLNINNAFSQNTNQVSVNDDIGPFKLFKNSISNTYSNLTASVGNIKNITKTKEQEPEKLEEGKMIELIPVYK